MPSTQKRTPSDEGDQKAPSGQAHRLAVSVHVHTERGPVVYQAGDVVADEHLTLIDNPDVWE